MSNCVSIYQKADMYLKLYMEIYLNEMIQTI